jgi:ADP-ribosylglycohydrolase
MYLDEEYINDEGYDLKREFVDYGNMPLKDLKLDEMGKIGYTFKCLGCAFWALDIISRYQERLSAAIKEGNTIPGLSFEKIIHRLVQECGDADTNAAVAGSIIGTYIGYDALPERWLNALPNKAWLDKKVDALFLKMGLLKKSS